MDFSPALTEHLNALTDALNDPGTDLQAVLSVLADEVSAAVSSFLGLTTTLYLDGNAVTLTAIQARADRPARASLLVPLAPLSGADPGSAVVFYAANPGAFVDLAEDTRRAYGPNGHEVVLDPHLPPTADPPGVNGLADLSVINQAIGVLIAQGHPPPEARTELHLRAANNGHRPPDAARRLLQSTAHGSRAPAEP